MPGFHVSEDPYLELFKKKVFDFVETSGKELGDLNFGSPSSPRSYEKPGEIDLTDGLHLTGMDIGKYRKNIEAALGVVLSPSETYGEGKFSGSISLKNPIGPRYYFVISVWDANHPSMNMSALM